MHKPTFMPYELRLLWHTNPDFYAIAVFIGGGGGLQFVDRTPFEPGALASAEIRNAENPSQVAEACTRAQERLPPHHCMAQLIGRQQGKTNLQRRPTRDTKPRLRGREG